MTPSGEEWKRKVNKLRAHMKYGEWVNLIEEMRISRVDQYFMAMKQGRSSPEELLGSLKIIKMPKAAERSFVAVGEKLFKGVYYKETGLVFPMAGAVRVRIVPNYDILFDPGCEVLDVASRVPGAVLPVEAQSKDLSDQFKIRVSISPNGEIGNIIAFFCEALALSVWGIADSALIEECGFAIEAVGDYSDELVLSEI